MRRNSILDLDISNSTYGPRKNPRRAPKVRGNKIDFEGWLQRMRKMKNISNRKT